MKIPRYIYPKFYDLNLVENNNENVSAKDLKLFKNLKISKEFKDTEKEHLLILLKSKEIWMETEQSLTKDQLNKDEEIHLFNFITVFKKIQYPSQKYNIGRGFTNSFRKIYEVCEKTNFIDKNLSKIRHFDICGLPGGFVLGVNYFLKTRTQIKEYQWYMQSHVSDKKNKNYFGDDFGLRKKYPKRFLVGYDGGDITKVETIEYYYNFFKNDRLDIVTSDCGLNFEEIWESSEKKYGREKQMAKIFFSQFISGVIILKKGGNFFMKSYHSFTPFMVSLIYFMGILFEKVKLIKPESSRQPKGKEIYFLCTGLENEIEEEIKEKLLDILKNFTDEDLEKNLISASKINKNIFKKIETTLSNYYLEKIERRRKITDFNLKLIGCDLIQDTNQYLKEIEKISKEYNYIMLNYVKDYFKKLNYKRIKNSDRLL